MEKLFIWLDKNKKKDTIIILFLKLVYSIEICTYPHVILSGLLGMFLPTIWTTHQNWAIVGGVLFIVENIVFCLCEKYHDRAYNERMYSEKVLENLSILLNSMNIYIHDTIEWKKNIFIKTSEMVCEKIREDFYNIYNCRTRVSVEYTFEKEINKVQHICRKMAGRASADRLQGKQATELDKREKYFSYKIFINDKIGINHLTNDEINDEKIWYKNPSHNVNVLQYVALANSFNNRSVSFILQIDFLDDFCFGYNNTEDEVSLFVNAYLKPYLNIVSMAYLLGCSKKWKIGEPK